MWDFGGKEEGREGGMEGGLGERWGSKCAVIIICTSDLGTCIICHGNLIQTSFTCVITSTHTCKLPVNYYSTAVQLLTEIS